MGRQEVEVGLAEDVLAPAQPQVQDVGDVHPLVPAGAVLDPEHDVLQEVEQLADRLAGKPPGHDDRVRSASGGAPGVHVERVERRARHHEQPVAVGAAEAEVGAAPARR
jgi:hypothetical protein